MTEPATQDPDDWSQRRLCPDEGCLGVIGPDGRCTLCGRFDPMPRQAQDLALQAQDLALQAQGPDQEAQGPDQALQAEPPPAAVLQDPQGEPAAPADDFAERRLCPDEGCLGLLGPDNRCKLCGAQGPSVQTSPADQPSP